MVATRALTDQKKLSDLEDENQTLRFSLEQKTVVLNDRTSRCAHQSSPLVAGSHET